MSLYDDDFISTNTNTNTVEVTPTENGYLKNIFNRIVE